jgi:multiple sugar transport system substrate-binding protein
MATVNFFGPDTDAFVDSVQRHAGEFTAETGLDLNLRIIPSDEYFSNKIHSYLDGAAAADVFMSGPVLLWEHVEAGYVEPLDSHVAGAGAAFDIGDFFPSLISSNRWTGRFGDALGSGPLWEIPVNYEAYNLAYVPAHLERHGIEIPETWEQYFAASRLMQERSGGAVRGFAQRGVQVWHTMYTGYATQFWSYGARDFDSNGRCAIASPEGVAATTHFIEALRQSGPPQWLDQRWYELAMDFCAGKYGFIVDSDHYTAFYENPSMSTIAGRTGYAAPPSGPTGIRASNMWTWSLVMNARSRNKANAWRFIEWAAGKSFLLRSAFEGNMNPTRKSTWDHERFHDASKGWGKFPEVARQLVEREAKVLVTPSPHYLRLADRWVRGLRDIYAGHQGTAEGLERAATDIDAIVRSEANA